MNEGRVELPTTTSTESDFQREHTANTTEPVVHDTICSLCDSTITGDRFVSVVHNNS